MKNPSNTKDRSCRRPCQVAGVVRIVGSVVKARPASAHPDRRKKFFISLVSHVRHLFSKANKEADAWFKGILIPLVKQVSENKQLLDQHLETLCKINESRDSLDTKIRELEKRCGLLEREEETLRNIHDRLHAPIPAEASTSPDGASVMSRAAS